MQDQITSRTIKGFNHNSGGLMSTSRREFLKNAAVAGAVVAAGSLINKSAEAVSPSVDKDLNGIIEMHVYVFYDMCK